MHSLMAARRAQRESSEPVRRALLESAAPLRGLAGGQTPASGLRQRLGNRGVQALVDRMAAPLHPPASTDPHADLKLSQPGDAHEREADTVADAVMRMPESAFQQPLTIARATDAAARASVQRMCAECEEEAAASQARPAGGLVQREAASAGSAREGIAPAVASHIRALQGGGNPLPAATRAFFEPRFGTDFGAVRVHTGTRAEETARAIDARAFTVGRDIAFAQGQYVPDSHEGRRLLAHELTHVVQQQGPTPRDQTGAQTAVASVKTKLSADATTELVSMAPQEKKPAKNPNPCTRMILAEGSCEYLVKNSGWRCCDPNHGIEHPTKTKDVKGNSCEDRKFTPLFTCDNTCNTAIGKGCDDDDNWIAIPGKKFTRKQCGDIFTICANGMQTTGYVRDRSVTHDKFEVSPGIQKALGVKVGDSFLGAIYKPHAKQNTIDKDACCNAPPR